MLLDFQSSMCGFLWVYFEFWYWAVLFGLTDLATLPEGDIAHEEWMNCVKTKQEEITSQIFPPYIPSSRPVSPSLVVSSPGSRGSRVVCERFPTSTCLHRLCGRDGAGKPSELCAKEFIHQTSEGARSSAPSRLHWTWTSQWYRLVFRCNSVFFNTPRLRRHPHLLHMTSFHLSHFLSVWCQSSVGWRLLKTTVWVQNTETTFQGCRMFWLVLQSLLLDTLTHFAVDFKTARAKLQNSLSCFQLRPRLKYVALFANMWATVSPALN